MNKNMVLRIRYYILLMCIMLIPALVWDIISYSLLSRLIHFKISNGFIVKINLKV